MSTRFHNAVTRLHVLSMLYESIVGTTVRPGATGSEKVVLQVEYGHRSAPHDCTTKWLHLGARTLQIS